jgi:subtilisin family serine protease
MNRLPIRTLAALGLAAVSFAAAGQQQQRQTYIVQLADAPAAAYGGTIAGLPATQPRAGAKLNVRSPDVRAYLNYLDGKRNSVLAQVNAAGVMHRYGVAFNGFSARLTAAEAAKLKASAGVVAVTPDEARHMDTTRTPGFLGLSGPGGLWSALDGAGRSIKGEDVIIGIVDGGIWPENPSFSDKVDALGKPVPYHQPGTVVYTPPPAKWAGTCQPGQGFTAAMCNNKLIGAQYFNTGFLAFGRPLWPTDYVGPRDENGHGTHTASTAGGNAGADAIVSGIAAGTMSGMAPRARIAAYRVCWSYVVDGTGAKKNTCFNSDSVAAIDKAVADGVDVINFSISGTRTNYLDPVEVAFFNAVAAGVFVATSAGNDGPANTVAHMSPWNMTVGASTHDRFTEATVMLGNGQVVTGPSYQTAGLTSRPLIASTDAGLPGADPTLLARCFGAADNMAAVLDPAKVAGKIVVCYRGGNVLVNKGINAKAAGAAGMILQNIPSGPLVSADTVFNIAFALPAVHLGSAYASTVLGYAASPTATASFGPGVQAAGVVAPVMADFSSRGPSLANANILKPDISAPGVDVVAAYVADDSGVQSVRDAIVAGSTPSSAASSLQGTSMASPHVAGIAALMKQLYPTWSPAAIKSALMTTATGVKLANGAADAGRFGYGAGHVNGAASANPGLVYDAGPIDHLRFLCGIGTLAASSATCQTYGSVSPWNLNLPSLTASDVVGRIAITRTVTNVAGASGTYTASVDMPGWSATVVPSVLTLAPGASASYTVDLTRTSAPVAAYRFGHVVWTDGAHVVRSPLTLKATLFNAPALIQDTRTSGAQSITVASGYSGALAYAATGMVPATRTGGTVAVNGKQCVNVVVPTGALLARFQLFNADTQGGASTDLDLEVHQGPNGTGPVVGASGGGTSDELVSLASPAAGTYSACTIGYATSNNAPAAYTLSSWVVGPAVGKQTLRASGTDTAVVGATTTVAVSWTAAKNQRSMGVLQFKDGAGAVVGTTLVAVMPN